ncbi:MAG: MFS transporter [Acidobacteriota bacterium]
MRRTVIPLYALAAVFQASGASGSSMLAPFFMKEHGFSLALVGIPLVINGAGRISSDLLSGVLANFVSSGMLLIAAAALALIASLFGMVFLEVMPLFLGIWVVLGFTEAMFGLSIRKIAFDQSPPAQQGRAQGQVAAALGIGFTLGPLWGGWLGSRWGADALFIVYALPQALVLVFILVAGSHRVGRPAAEGSAAVWREGRQLFRRPSFLAACLAIFQAFLFLIGVTRVAFPFLAVTRGGLGLDAVGTIVALSRLADTLGRFFGGRLSDMLGTRRVVLIGVLLTVPMFLLQVYGTGFLSLLIPLSLMTLGFGFTNVGGVTCALQTAGSSAKGLGLGLARASNSTGSMLGPLLAGALIEQFDYEGGFFSMALISLVIFLAVWYGFSRDNKIPEPSK